MSWWERHTVTRWRLVFPVNSDRSCAQLPKARALNRLRQGCKSTGSSGWMATRTIHQAYAKLSPFCGLSMLFHDSALHFLPLTDHPQSSGLDQFPSCQEGEGRKPWACSGPGGTLNKFWGSSLTIVSASTWGVL